MLGAVFAVLYIGWVQIWLIAQAVFGAVTMDVVMGFWFIVSIVAAAIVRKPGVAFASEVLAAAVDILLGSPSGLLLLVTGAIQGAGADGFEELCRQYASSERSPPGAKIISGKPLPCTS